jgi:hypothetical protein
VVREFPKSEQLRTNRVEACFMSSQSDNVLPTKLLAERQWPTAVDSKAQNSLHPATLMNRVEEVPSGERREKEAPPSLPKHSEKLMLLWSTEEEVEPTVLSPVSSSEGEHLKHELRWKPKTELRHQRAFPPLSALFG